MSLPFIDLKAQYAHLKSDIDARMQAVLDHGQYIMGPEVGELEDKLADFCGSKHAIAVANGTDALQIALMTYKIGSGDAVFIPSFTFTATAEVVLILGAEPVFVDVQADTYNLDVTDLERKVKAVRDDGRLTPKAVIGAGLFGQPADYTAIMALAGREKMIVIDDAAQSFGASLGNARVGCLADITTTSFFPAKPLGCYGDGGALFLSDDDVASVARSISQHGKGTAKYDIIRVGMNSRLDTLQAAVLLAKLNVFEDEIKSRNCIASSYEQALSSVVKTPVMMNGATSVWAQYTIRTPERDALAQHLQSHGIPTAVYYPLPMHQQTAYENYAGDPGSMAVSERLSKEVLSLPLHPYMAEHEVEQVTHSVRSFFGA